MIYALYFSELSLPKTGLSPSIDVFIKVSDGSTAGIPPSVSELSNGFYKFDYSPTEDIACRIDSNDGSMANEDRYILFIASPNDNVADAVLEELISDHESVSGSMAEFLRSIFALCQGNFFLDQTTFNARGLLTSGRIRIFRNNSFTATDGGSGEGEFLTLDITAVAEADPISQLKTYEVKEA